MWGGGSEFAHSPPLHSQQLCCCGALGHRFARGSSYDPQPGVLLVVWDWVGPGARRAAGRGRSAQLLAAERSQTSPTLRLRGGQSALWLVHVVVRAVYDTVHREESVRGSCDWAQLIRVNARACGLWCLIGEVRIRRTLGFGWSLVPEVCR